MSSNLAQTTDNSQFLNLSETANHLKVNKVTIWRWVNSGRFPKPDRIVHARSKFWSMDLINEWKTTHVVANHNRWI